MDGEAYERVATEQKDRIFGYAVGMLRNAEEARDVAQEALVRLWEHRERVDAAGARFWLTRTAHNLCIDRLRGRRRRGEVGDDGLEATEADPGPSPERLAAADELGGTLERILDQLAPQDRAVLLMREVQGMPYDEIAAALGVPLGTLKARLHRARDRLRSRLIRAGVTP